MYILLSPDDSTVEGYQHTYVDSIEPIRQALKSHPVKRLIVVSSTRVYGENSGETIDDHSEIHSKRCPRAYLAQYGIAMAKVFSVTVRDCASYRDLWASIDRLKRMAEHTQTYPNIHYSNRIHIDDLARFWHF